MKNIIDFMPKNLNISAHAGRLDLAIEANSLLRGEANTEIPGVAENKIQENGIDIHIITVLNQQGAELMGRPPGQYITLDIADANIDGNLADIAACAAGCLQRLLPQRENNVPLLVVGLGNSNATPDALGPTVVAMTYATRHICQRGDVPEGIAPVCAIAPGVLGNSGIETAEIIRGICQHIRPGALLVVDSLAAASVSRVGTTIQMADTGIRPGSGLGNNRTCIDQDLAGCPVIAIGIPTVVDSAAIIAETVDTICGYWQDKDGAVPSPPDAALYDHAETSLLSRFHGRLMVTPKDIDALIAKDAQIIAAAIAIAVHPAADKDNYQQFIC